MDEKSLGGGVTYKKILVSDVIKQIEVPSWQRLLSNDHVDEIYDTIKKQFAVEEKSGLSQPKVFGVIEIAQHGDKYYILDGNHRMNAYKRIFEIIHKDLFVVLNVIQVQREQEARDLFDKINNSVPLVELPIGVTREKSNEVIRLLRQKPFGKMIKGIKKVNPPFVCANKLQHVIAINLKRKSTNEIVELICDLNEKFLKRDDNYFINLPNNRRKTKMAVYLKHCRDYGFILGLLDLNKMFYDITHVGSEIKTEPTQLKSRTQRKSVPKCIRHRLWHTYYGNDRLKDICLLCKGKQVSRDDYEVAHKKAHSNGGTYKEDNLFPCCSNCNKSMGNKDLSVFEKEYGVKILTFNERTNDRFHV